MAIGGQITARGVTMEDFAHAMTDVTSRPSATKSTSPASTISDYPWTPDDATPGAVGTAVRPRQIKRWPLFLQP